MTYAPQTIQSLAAYWIAQKGDNTLTREVGIWFSATAIVAAALAVVLLVMAWRR